MWWNIIPSTLITGGCIVIPCYFTAALSYFYVGSIHGRDRTEQHEHYLLFRDENILDGANPYRQHLHLGLDSLKD